SRISRTSKAIMPRPLRGGGGGRKQETAEPSPQILLMAGKALHMQLRHAVQPERLVRRSNDDAACGEMAHHQSGKHALGGRIEGCGRLVEKPDGPPGDKQLGHRHAPLLAGGKIAERQMRDTAEPDGFRRFIDADASSARKIPEEFLPEAEILLD